MDEDDSQDELINRSTSHSKGKRAAVWAISDDSDDSEESAEGESDSEEEEGEDHVNGEDDEEEEEEEEEEEGNEEEDDEEELEEGAVGGTSAGFEVLSSDEDSDKCPICLNSFTNQPVATPESCEHYFCFDCILEWAKNANSCPVDRLAFNSIYLRKCYGGKVKKMITVQKPVKEGQEETVDLTLEQTNCEVCGGSDREDRLLLCDGCDAGYHMECLTPPLNSVPVEEWFCPECQANNRHLNLAEELSDSESLPSTAHPATSRSQPRAAGPTRAIARTQQSERVRANVNRHRITQARSSQLAPTYLIQSTWLDETINAVVAGLNTAVYVRDFTPRVPSGRRRKYVKRRKVKTKKTSSAQGKRSTSMNTMVKRRKHRGRRTKRRKQKVVKKSSTSRSRIASNLGIVKDKKSSSLPTVYRPSEHTLSNMRVDIGAASLSIYGDPFDLDPFVDREEDGEQARVTSLLEAKRRGISRSALRSHQPVARPITASLSRRDLGVPQSGDVVEAAPVPDLLGSILSGQSMLLMDSSDVVINRDGSLKATKPVTPSPLLPASRSSSSSGDASALISPVSSSPSLVESSLSLHHSGALPGPSSSAANRDLTPSSSRSPPFMASPPSHTQTAPHADVSRRRHPGLLSPHSARPTTSAAHWGSGGAGASREISPPTVHPTPDFSTKSKGTTQSQSQSKKAPTKPMWVDVSVLPRIPKIKRDNSSEGTSQRGISDRSGRGNANNPSAVSNGYGMHEAGTNSLSGDKGRQQSVDQQKSRVDGQAQRSRPGGAGSSSSSFSNSFSSASSSTGYPANQSRHPPAPSSSSAVSFRINSSGNSWHSRRLSIPSSSAGGDARPGHCREKEDEAKKRQLRRDKQKLLASHTAVGMEQENIYDPFNPTLSDSSSSDSEAESTDPARSQRASHEGRPPVFGNVEATVKEENSREINTKTWQVDASQEQPRTTQTTVPEVVRRSEDVVKVEKESTVLNIKTEKPADVPDIEIKKEPGLDDEKDSERCDESINSCMNSETSLSTPSAHHSLGLVKTERHVKTDSGQSSASHNRPVPEPLASSSAASKKTLKEDVKSDSTLTSKSLSRDSRQNKRPSKPPKEQCSSSSETDRSRRGDRHTSAQGGRNKERDKDKERSSRQSPSGERRRARSSSSDSSQPGSSDRARRKRRRSRSRSKDDHRRRRSRSASSSSSRERSRRKKQKQRSRDDERERRRPSKDKRRSRSRSKSQSKSRSRSRSRSKSKDRNRSRSRSRSRSRERRKEHARQQHSSHSSRDKVESRPKDKRRPRSRSTSRERRKKEASSKSSQKTSGPSTSSSKDTKQLLEKKKVKDVTRSSIQEKRVPKVNKPESPSCASAAKVVKEEKGVTVSQRADLAKEIKPAKEIKKEKLPCLDMFEESPSIKPVKKEEPDTPAMTVDINEETQTPHKTASCELAIIKREPDTSEICQLPPVTPPSMLTTTPKAGCQQTLCESAAQSSSSTTQQNTAGSTVPVKQEARQPSDSDEDFNVDVMLDNLDYVKSEPPDGSGTAPKQEKDGQPASTLAGTKTKTQVKRVTWNLQEPEGPQPEKSASKLALYKLKLKQEGARRPFSAVQTSGQGISGTAGDPSSKGADVPPSTSSHSDGLHPEALSTSGQTDGDEGDQSRKDKYLKKLHMLERAIEEVKLAIKPFYQRRDINKGEYKEILRKAVQKVCHSKSGEINPVKVGNLVKAYVDKYKHARKHRKEDDSGKAAEVQPEAMQISDSP